MAKRFTDELSVGSPKTAILSEEYEPAGFISFGSCRYGNMDKSWMEIWRYNSKILGTGIAEN